MSTVTANPKVRGTTRSIMQIIGSTDETFALRVEDEMCAAGLNFSECTERRFARAAREAAGIIRQLDQSKKLAVMPYAGSATPAPAHTPGPWELKACNGKMGEAASCYVTFHDRGSDVPLMRGDFCRSEADALLIAAAPELAAALKRLLSFCLPLVPGFERSATEAQLAACDALAKAGIK